MKRRHLRNDIVEFCAVIRSVRPDAVFGADLIAGFPTETDAQFQNTLKLIKDAGLTHLHVFPYSIREDTPAARMPQIPIPTIKERAAQLRAAGEISKADFLKSCVGRRASVLVESNGIGQSEHYVPVRLTSDPGAGALINVTVAATDGGYLIAA